MKEEILTAKEWLAKNLVSETFTTGDYWIDRMEKYANYKNRILEDRIKEFSKWMEINSSPYNYRMYIKHFNIEE